MTAHSILPRLLASATVVAAMTLTAAPGTAFAQVHPRSGGPASQIRLPADADATTGLAEFPADTSATARTRTARAPNWITGARRLGEAVARAAALVRDGGRTPLLHIHF